MYLLLLAFANQGYSQHKPAYKLFNSKGKNFPIKK